MEKLYLKRSWRIGTCLMVLLTFMGGINVIPTSAINACRHFRYVK